MTLKRREFFQHRICFSKLDLKYIIGIFLRFYNFFLNNVYQTDQSLIDTFFNRYALLENKNFTLDTECLLQTLEQCFSECPIESLDEKIFKKILPKAQHFLSQVIL